MRTISVCLTHYNRVEKLAATLESLAKQTVQPNEVFVSDDASPEDPREIVMRFQHSFPKLIFIRNDYNLGMPGNLNAVIQRASGDYIANLHDADVFDRTLLEKWAAALDRHPSASFVFCGLDDSRGTGRLPQAAHLPDICELTPGREFFEYHFLHRRESVVWGTVMARRGVYIDLLPFDPDFRHIADVDMWMRMCLVGDVAYIKERLIYLDNTKTPWRRFAWERVLLENEIQRVNIRRFFKDDSSRLRRELARHQLEVYRGYCRRIAGRAWHRDFRAVLAGLVIFYRTLHGKNPAVC